MNNRESGRIRDIAVLWVGAFLLRMGLAAKLGTFLAMPPPGLYDDGAFIDMARTFLGQIPADIPTHAPGLSLALMPLLLLGPAKIIAVVFFQWVVGAAVAPLTMGLSRQMGFSREAALMAGLLCAVNPMLVFFSTRVMADSFFVTLVVSFFWLWLRAWQSGRPRQAALAGVLGGLASLTRGSLLPFGATLALIAFLWRRQQPRWPVLIACCGLTWAAIIAPWTARNWLRFHRFIPISVQGGWNLYEGMSLDLEDIRVNRPQAMGREAQEMGLRDPIASDEYFGRKAKAEIRENPRRFAVLCARKAIKFWRVLPYPPHGLAVRVSEGLFALAMFGLALWGLIRGAGAKAGFPFLAAWVVFVTLLHSIFASNLRYRLPLEPIIAVIAGAGADDLRRLVVRSRKS